MGVAPALWLWLSVAWGEPAHLCAWQDPSGCQVSCEAGNAPSCARMGHMLTLGVSEWGARVVAVDLPAARAAYDRACTGGYLPACNHLGLMWSEGKGGPRDKARADALYAKACDKGDGTGCYNLAVGHDDAGAIAQARVLYEKGCALGDGPACLEAGGFYEIGDGVPRDLSKALALYGRSFRAPVEAKSHLVCPEDAAPLRSVQSFGARVEHYCGRPGKRPVKHGPWIEWASEEDEHEGLPHGAITGKGSYVEGKKHGLFERFDERGRLRSRQEYVDDVEEGLSERYTDGVLAEKKLSSWLAADDPRLEAAGLTGQKVRLSVEYDAEGRRHEETFYDAQGSRHGPRRRWYEGGQLREEERFEHGKQIGLERSWHEGGALAFEQVWADGKKNGPHRRLGQDGAVLAQGSYAADQKHGPWFEKTYDEHYRGVYANGVRVGEWTFYGKAGQVECTVGYVADRLHGPARCFHEDGKLREVGAYAEGRMTGTWTSTHPDGKRQASEGLYAGGEPQGTHTEWWPNGVKRRVVTYEGGCPVGVQTEWHDNRKKATEGSTTSCERSGTWRRWAEDGALEEEGSYAVGGVMVGTWTWYWPDGSKRSEEAYDTEGRRVAVRRWDERGALQE